MKKIGLIFLIGIIAYFTITIGFYSLKKEKRFTKDEVITLLNWNSDKCLEDKQFHTEKETYKNNEEVIFYKDNKPLVSWNYKKVTTAKLEDIKNFEDLNNNDIIRIEFEIKNFNYMDGKEAYEPPLALLSWGTDLGEPIYQSASIPFTPLKIGETGTCIHFLHSDKSVEKVKKVYMRYYYAETLLNLPIGTHSNYVDFELDVNHQN